ncbi:IclR family transcriptional regulator [Galbitalea soli]|uniref:Glycerol operon regulatory protein n=1 Tax=Galbitalea soli TaxID=1268042 RepID=A0A7C9TQZ4_9MICO|nr:IclR family transcriptional regulator [Galbitalea soli]NEM90964.1 IclR family transcriptional regulator [Galbitalea soli]NYJ29651.1 DNA-binding IclR family transcriptional regulator [Galbitalea soli]
MTEPQARRDVPSARATLRILMHLAAQRGPVPAQSIATAVGLPRSTAYRLLAVLQEEGFVLHYPELGRYGIGVSAFELSSGFSRQEPLARLGRPILAALVDRIGETAHLAVLHGRDVLYLVEERAPRRPALVTDVGVRLPSHLTASGRALLATLPRSQLRALFPDRTAFAQRTDAGVTRYSELTRLLDRVRADGYAAEDGDVTAGKASVAVAVRDHAGWPAAGIAVTFARETIPPERWPDLAAEVHLHAAELSRRIRGRL